MCIKQHKHPRFTGQSLIADRALRDNKKEKGASQDNRKEKDARGVTRSRLRLMGPGAPLLCRDNQTGAWILPTYYFFHLIYCSHIIRLYYISYICIIIIIYPIKLVSIIINIVIWATSVSVYSFTFIISPIYLLAYVFFFAKGYLV